MRRHVLRREQRLPHPVEDTFAFFADAQNLASITPPWLGFRILTPGPIEMRRGALIAYRISLHGLPMRWLTRIALWEPPHRFADVQVSGPYHLWHHTHTFEPDGGGTIMRDIVRYALPLGPLGAIAHAALLRRDLARIFDHRRDAVATALERVAQLTDVTADMEIDRQKARIRR